jgi:hypothetical protein
LKRAPLILGAAGLSIFFIASTCTANTPPPPLSLALGASGEVCKASGSLKVSAPTDGALKASEVAKVAYAAGFRGGDLVIAVAVAYAESGWVPTASNHNRDNSWDYGLFQINTVHKAILAGGEWRDPGDNAVMAYQVWLDAKSRWTPWVTYNNGSHLPFMAQAQAAVSGLVDAVKGLAGCTDTNVAAGGVTDPGVGPQGANGLTPRAAAVKAASLTRWGCQKHSAPCVAYIGGYAKRNIAGTGTVSDHATGNADDIMLPRNYKGVAENRMGWDIANFWRVNAKAAGVKYIIFDAKIWSVGDKDWRPYSHPGGAYSDTLQHLDHVHVSVLS